MARILLLNGSKRILGLMEYGEDVSSFSSAKDGKPNRFADMRNYL